MLVSIVLTTHASKAKEVKRRIDPGANGSFDYTIMDMGEYYLISCFASEVCNICPRNLDDVNYFTPNDLAYDPTDLIAMNELFGFADNAYDQGQSDGSHTVTYIVRGEPAPWVYQVRWTLVDGRLEQIWMRVH